MNSDQESAPLAESPIIEAVFDFKVELPPDLDFSDILENAIGRFGEHYPTRIKIMRHTLRMSLEEDDHPSLDEADSTTGLRFDNPEGNQLIQVRQDGFSFNRLAPYVSFDDYLPEVRRCWELYREVFQPVMVRRISLRYINRILIPISGDGTAPLGEFVTVAPRLPEIEGVSMAGFMSQVQLRETDHELIANMTLTGQPIADGNTDAPMILDIDTFQNGSFDPDSQEIWDSFDLLRRLKNRIFRGSLSPQCLQRYQ
ncbi:MAG: TIGR04255 family protein [Verrucomicrobiales bacterium]